MSKPITVVLLGADRVGKSTIVTNTVKKLEKDGYDAKALHFSGPQPYHSSPIQQYIEPFDLARDEMAQVIVCDRGFSEVCFYDKFRRHVDISHEWAQSAESYFLEKSLHVLVFLVKRRWEWSQPHHVKEVLDLHPDATAWFVKNQLEMRKAEHYAYYEYMEDYLNNYSLLPHKVLEDTGLNYDVSDQIISV